MAPANDKSKLRFTFDLRILCLLLVAAIITMLLIWKPWSSPAAGDQVVEVDGDATLTATPDEFVFHPNYQFKNADKTAALQDISKKSDEVTKKLKELGVKENDIKTDSSGYDLVYREADADQTTYTLQLAVKVSSKDLAQKVQDYLVTTSPMGAISPMASFSEKKRKELETKARDDATKNAREKADQMAQNLGFKVGKVKAVKTGTGFGNNMPFEAHGSAMTMDARATSAASSFAVHPGENELQYGVTVIYFIR